MSNNSIFLDYSAVPNFKYKKNRLDDDNLVGELEKLSRINADLSMAVTLQKISIASELKDNISQFILLAKINLDLFTAVKNPDGQAPELLTVSSLLDQALSGIRALYSRLSPPLLSENGLEATLQYLCLQMEKEKGLRVEFVNDGREKSGGDIFSTVIVFFVVREILFNMARHVNDHAARLFINRAGNCLRLVVEDPRGDYDFSGFISEHRKIGTLNICQCIRQLGGDVDFISVPGERTAITILAPLAKTAGVISGRDELPSHLD